MAEWRTLIVEDDPTVAALHRAVVARLPMFRVVGVAASGEEALRMLVTHRPKLMLLDLTLRGTDGLTLLRAARARGIDVEVIAVTASRSADTVRSMVQLGVVDYLVKPFSPDRLRQSLTFFLHRAGAGEGELDQERVDALCASGRRAGRWLPKGLVAEKLEDVRSCVAAAPAPLSAEEVGAALGMARVTARRYLEYLLATAWAEMELECAGPGRPRRLYRRAPVPVRRSA